MKAKDIYGVEHDINGPSARGVINGKRTRVVDTTIPPYNSVVQLPTPLNGEFISFASGSVIGKNTILTAAHVGTGMLVGDMVTPALNGEDKPYGSFQIKSILISDGWSSNHDTSFDFAVIIVEKNAEGKSIGDIVPKLEINRLNVENIVIGTPVKVIGYPGDKGSDQMWESPGELLLDDGKFYCLNAILGWENRILVFDCDSVMGNSGSPLLNENNEIIGLATIDNSNVPAICNGETGGNGGPIMCDEAVDWIIERVQ